MSLDDYIVTVKRLDDLIHRHATGTPSQLAEKFSMSERQMRRIISTLKEHGAPIRYSKVLSSYVYEENGRFLMGWKKIKVYAEIDND